MWPFKKRDQKRDQGQQPPEVLSDPHEEPITAIVCPDIPIETRKPPRLVEFVGAGYHADFPNQRCLLLTEKLTGINLRVWVGVQESLPIEFPQEGGTPTHPLTHHLMMSVATTLGWTVEFAYINALVDETYMAKVVIVHEDERRVLDARPCDAFALAVRAEAPMLVADWVMEQAGTSGD